MNLSTTIGGRFYNGRCKKILLIKMLDEDNCRTADGVALFMGTDLYLLFSEEISVPVTNESTKYGMFCGRSSTTVWL